MTDPHRLTVGQLCDALDGLLEDVPIRVQMPLAGGTVWTDHIHVVLDTDGILHIVATDPTMAAPSGAETNGG